MRKYYQEHKEEAKKYQKQYYQEHKEEAKRYYQEHKEEAKKYQKQYYQEHKEEAKRYYQEHKEEKKRYQKQREKKRIYKRQGNYLKKKLEKLDKNQPWLARQLGVPKKSVSNYLRGVYLPKDDSLRKRLYKILKVKPQDLESILNEDSDIGDVSQ